MKVQDGDGKNITSTDAGGGVRALDVNIGQAVTLDITGDSQDMDTGAGTDNHEMVGIALPAASGHVVGGTSTNPIRTDPTGTTPQPVTDNGAALSVDDFSKSITIDGMPDKTSGGSATTMLNAASVTTGATTAIGDCTALDLSNYDGAVIEVLVAAPAGSTGKLDVKLRYSQDGTNYDTNDDADFWQLTVTANGDAYRSRPVPDADVMRYAKVLVKNNDAAQTYTVTIKGYGVVSKKAVA